MSYGGVASFLQISSCEWWFQLFSGSSNFTAFYFANFCLPTFIDLSDSHWATETLQCSRDSYPPTVSALLLPPNIAAAPLVAMIVLTGSVLECNLAHRRSVAELCMVFQIKCNPIYPLSSAFPLPYVPARVTRVALVAHKHSFAPPRCSVTNLKFHGVTSEISFRFVQKTLKTSDEQLS